MKYHQQQSEDKDSQSYSAQMSLHSTYRSEIMVYQQALYHLLIGKISHSAVSSCLNAPFLLTHTKSNCDILLSNSYVWSIEYQLKIHTSIVFFPDNEVVWTSKIIKLKEGLRNITSCMDQASRIPLWLVVSLGPYEDASNTMITIPLIPIYLLPEKYILQNVFSIYTYKWSFSNKSVYDYHTLPLFDHSLCWRFRDVSCSVYLPGEMQGLVTDPKDYRLNNLHVSVKFRFWFCPC